MVDPVVRDVHPLGNVILGEPGLESVEERQSLGQRESLPGERRVNKETETALLDRTTETTPVIKMIFRERCIRAVNYHGTPPKWRDQLQRQIEFFRQHFTPIDQARLKAFLKGDWIPDKQGLILSFDDGLKSNFDVAAPILERYDWPGWFFIPAGLVEEKPRTPAKELSFLRSHSVTPLVTRGSTWPFLMDWNDIRRLTETGHIVGCHTYSHPRLGKDLSDKRAYQEVVESKYLLENKIDHSVSSFAWVGGELSSYSRKVQKLIHKAEYNLSFLTNCSLIRPGDDPLLLDRTNIEANWSVKKCVLYLSGLVDLYYWPKRARVRQRLAD